MGAADVVPGVSGGTIAFITGIYEELLFSIKSVDLAAIRLLVTFQWKAFAQKVNIAFLATLFAGIFFSIITLSRLILYLMEFYPIHVWAYFFGLVIASVVIVGKQVKQWALLSILALALGTLIAYLITTLHAVSADQAGLPYVFMCGSIAICAMILPGISGSFMLVLLGAYQLIFGALQQAIDSLAARDLAGLFGHGQTIVVFALGCVVGLALFSRVLTWLYQHYHDTMVAFLIGFLIGSLNAIWPWKKVVEYYTDRHGMEKPLVRENVSPLQFGEIAEQEAFLVAALLLMFAGFMSVYGVEWIARQLKKGNT